MTQASPTIGANKSGLTYRQEDNDGKKALLNHHKGSSAPAYAEAGILWLDDAATPWRLKIYDGADWVKIVDINAATNAVTPYLGTTALTSSGSIIDRAYASHASNTSLSATIPLDDSVPQNTEGTEILSASLTPKSASSRVRVRFTGFGTASGPAQIIAALFIDSGASAVQAVAATNAGAAAPSAFSFEYEYAPGDTSAHAYKVRVGPSAGTMRMNGSSSGRYFGGVAASSLVVEEISP